MKPMNKVCVMLCVTLAGVLSAFAPSASASDASIKQAIKSYAPKILVAEGQLLSAVGSYAKTGNPSKVESALSNSISVFHALRSRIAAQSAVATKVKEGKRKLLKGLEAVTSAYKHLKIAFAVKAVNSAAAKLQAQRAEAAVKKGRRELREGLQLLK
jgi:hypothetical protein